MRWPALILITLWGLVVPVSAQAQLELDLIAVFQSDIPGAVLIEHSISPGDLDGDGFSEIFVAELGSPQRILIYKGGNPPDQMYDMVTHDRSTYHSWIPDINGDGFKDFVYRNQFIADVEQITVYYGSADFYQKTEPDLVISSPIDSLNYFGSAIYSGDINGDNENDLITSKLNRYETIDGRLDIYYGGTSFDSLLDTVINIHDTSDLYYECFNAMPVGDINGDGLVDLAYSSFSDSEPGFVNIILGNVPLDTLASITLEAPFENFYHSHTFGQAIVPLEDINKDGYDDFCISGSTCWPCIYYGGPSFNTEPRILGDTTIDITQGDRIANIGDINHDGWDDIGVGHTSYQFGSGIVYIYFGSQDMDSDADIIMPYNAIEPVPGSEFGYSVGAAGDFNGDGIDDVVITSRERYISGVDRGRVYVFAGDPMLPTPAEDETESSLPKNHNILHQNFPNPFNSTTQIKYELMGSYDREVELSIYNILGQKVRTLYKGTQSGGEYSISWDGKDDDGRNMPSGIYFYHLKSSDQRESKKMIYLK